YTLIYLLYHIQIYKNILIEEEFDFIEKTHDRKITEMGFYSLFKDDLVVKRIVENAEFLDKLFTNFGTKKYEGYYEMSPHQFLLFVKELATKKGFDYLLLTKDMKFLDDCSF